MKQSIEKLYKFLSLEVQGGYKNRAVIGGLHRMIKTWENEARVDDLPESLIRAVSARLRDYHQLTVQSRAEILAGLWKRVKRSYDENLPELERGLVDSGISNKSLDVSIEHDMPLKDTSSPEKSVDSKVSATTATKLTSPSSYSESNNQEEGYVISEGESLAEDFGEEVALDAPLTVLSGVGPRYAKSLSRLGMDTLGHVLYNFPRRYDDYSKLKPINRISYEDELTVIGTVEQIHSRPARSGRVTVIEATVSDGSGKLRVTWFNQPWLVNRLRGKEIVLSGKVDQYLGRLALNNPEWELLEKKTLHTNRIVPVYPLTANISQRWLRDTINKVVEYWAPRVQDPLPDEVLRSAELIPLSKALSQIHYPDSWENLEKARHRLAFDEIFLLQLGVFRQRHLWTSRTARIFETPLEWINDQLNQLPFDLTGAQKRALDEIRADLTSGRPMNRLLQGDVGSGKTVVAAMAVAMVTRHGAQAAIMAPTSILAEQHYQGLSRLLSSEGGVLDQDQIRLMISATPDSEKAEIRSGLESGYIKLVIGTHALIEDPVTFADLQLAIIDEQHRFGVNQRAALREKGKNPHLLVMTATPIPRSLALTVYGDLDLSIIDEMPPGRQHVGTHILLPIERERAYALIRKEIEKDHRAFIIYPLVEETDKSEAKAAVEEHSRLDQEIFPSVQIGLLHGRLPSDEKEAVMEKFRNGEFQIIVSTTVVEVGVDIPNATVMVIEGANRFGLAQLHQLRGRVGRGKEKSYCLLIPESDSAVENERLSAMVETNDGFILAERDLEQRGPGEFLGIRQSGYSELRMAKLTDVPLIIKARSHAQMLFQSDPEIDKPEHRQLATALERFWMGGEGDIS